jgi:hypothetical protein
MKICTPANDIHGKEASASEGISLAAIVLVIAGIPVSTFSKNIERMYTTRRVLSCIHKDECIIKTIWREVFEYRGSP